MRAADLHVFIGECDELQRFLIYRTSGWEGSKSWVMKTSASANAFLKASLVLGDIVRSPCRKTLARIWSNCFTMSKRPRLAVLATLFLTISLEKRCPGHLSVALVGLTGDGGAEVLTCSDGPITASAGVSTASGRSITTWL